MLQEISIKNFAIIEEVQVSFENGMTILTGETGAGKSIIIDAMNLLLGSRASSDFVRHGTDKAEIEGLFFYDDGKEDKELAKKLEEFGFESTGEVLLRREIFANGRSVCRVNGQMVNLMTLREIGEFLVDIHGQHDNQELMNPKHHLKLLDEFGDDDFEQAKLNYQTAFNGYKNLRQKLVKKQENEQEFAQRIEILQFQAEEIEAAEIDLEQDEQLTTKRAKLYNARTIAESLNTAFLALDDEDYSSLGNIKTAMAELESVSEFDKIYHEMAEKVSEAYYLLEDAAGQIERASENLEFNPTELNLIEERIMTLTTLKRKYGPELVDVLNYHEKIQLELGSLTGEGVDSQSLEQAVRDAQADLLEQSKVLNDYRHQIAESLEEDIKHELAELYMEKADFKVHFESGKFSATGNEHVEFYIQTNPGEGFKPLAKTASGGELSRLMLAIKSSFSRRENKTSIVFDEVDTGVSGRVAQAIAQKIYKIGRSGQVLAISHLPQVVAIADTQLFIEKSSTDDVTTSTVRKLTADERIEEIAKMLAGDDLTPEALAQAKKLISK